MNLLFKPGPKYRWAAPCLVVALALSASAIHAEGKPHEAAQPAPPAAHGAPHEASGHGPAQHAESGSPGPRTDAGHPGFANHEAGHNEPGRREMGRAEMGRHEMGRHEMMREHHVFREHDVRRFGHADLDHWRGGRWNNSCRDGRCGWWWYSSGQYYYYDRPIYPYPLAVSSVVLMEPVTVLTEPAMVVQPMQMAPPRPVAAAPKFLYYCDSPKGYYPQVPSCPTGYREVTGR